MFKTRFLGLVEIKVSFNSCGEENYLILHGYPWIKPNITEKVVSKLR